MNFNCSARGKSYLMAVTARCFLVVAGLVFASLPTIAAEKTHGEKPNIVLILMDNFGWGELGVYGGGILRGAPTPRIDQLAAEGLRLANFNVETVCTTSRAALMTGRYGVRTGAFFPAYTTGAGLTQWEITLAEMLGSKGYVSGIFGKWHLGDTPGRFPTDQGFEEWYGIPNTSNESRWQDGNHPDQYAHPSSSPRSSFILEGKKGKAVKKVKLYNNKNRPLIDEEITDRAINFMQRQVRKGKPFFTYIPYTQTHVPITPHPDFAGKTGKGNDADVLAQIDYYTGRLLDAIDKLGIRDNTIFIFTSDNGGIANGPWNSNNGFPFFSEKEGALRVPFIVRWPQKIPGGRYSNEIVHLMDIFPTLASIVGAEIPADRLIDGVDQTDFFKNKKETSNREGFVIYAQEKVLGVKWRDWKMTENPTIGNGFAAFYNVLERPAEISPQAGPVSWLRFPIGKFLTDHLETFERHPAIAPGTPDPYVPND